MMKRPSPSLTIAGGTDTARPVKMPRSLRFEEILEIKAPDTLIKNRLPARGLVFIYGPPKSGKTFFAIDMCMSLARGEPWHGTPVKQAGVLYVAGEGVHGLGMRMLAYVRKRGHKPRTRFRAIPEAVTLHESVAALEQEMRSIEIEEGWRPEVLVLDTLARTKGDLDENSGEMAAYISAADHFIACGMLVIVIHHPGKDAEKGLRGWSGLLGALDLQIQVLKPGETVVANWTHGKDLPDAEPLPFRLVATETGDIDGWGEPVSSCELPPKNSLPRVT
jgi:RecA-family ATPase